MSAEILHQNISGAGITLHVARSGEGPPVILLHGFPENWTSWRHQIRALAEAGFSVWAPDLRGYSDSDRPTERGAYRLRWLIDDVAALVRNTGHHRAHIVGHDWGGIVAWTFAGQYPDLTEKLVILNAPHLRIFRRKLWFKQMWRSWYVLFFQIPLLPEWILLAVKYAVVRHLFRHHPARKGTFSEAEIEEYIRALSKPGALTAALNYYRQNFGAADQNLAREATISAPCLVIWGEKDPALGRELLEGLEEVAPRVRIHRIPDAGHWVQNEAADEVNGVMIRFLKASGGE